MKQYVVKIILILKNIFIILPGSSTRSFGLDAYRAAAIIIVVLAHGNYITKAKFWIRTCDGVELFFVLSGFLIGTIIINTIEKTRKVCVHQLAKELFIFWKRRWFRTLPNYYLVLLLNILWVSNGLTAGGIHNLSWKFIFFLQNLSKPFYGFFVESWSLSIEEWFYILFPVTVFTLLLCLRRWLTKKHIIFIGILTLIFCPLLYRIMSEEKMNGNIDLWDATYRQLILMRLDSIIYGVLGAYIKYYYKDYWYKGKYTLFIFGITMVYLNFQLEIKPDDFYFKTFYYIPFSIGSLLMLPLADSIKTHKTTLGKAITHISLISYSMYLINLSLVSLVITKHFVLIGRLKIMVLYLCYWIMVLLFSTLLYKYFEKPIMDLRDKKFM